MIEQRKPLKTPTPRQSKAAILLSENINAEKPRSTGEILKEAGYSDSTAQRSTQVIQSEGFQAVLEMAGISDKRLAATINDGLDAQNYLKTERVEGIGKNRLKTEEIITIPDLNTRHKYLETSLRLKGYGKIDNTFNFNFVNNARINYQ
jgi:hypothetical protein